MLLLKLVITLFSRISVLERENKNALRSIKEAKDDLVCFLAIQMLLNL